MKYGAILLAVCSAFAAAADHDLLSVSGHLCPDPGNGNHPPMVFSRQMLLQLPQVTVTTKTDWTPRKAFKGPLVADVLAKAGMCADAKEVLVETLDGYPVKIPVADFRLWHVILAMTADGQALTLRNKGPLWIMYPVDDHPAELDNNVVVSRMAWAVTGLTAR